MKISTLFSAFLALGGALLSLRPAVAQSVTPDADADVVRLDARFA